VIYDAMDASVSVPAGLAEGVRETGLVVEVEPVIWSAPALP
jgi:hypothetical protein